MTSEDRNRRMKWGQNVPRWWISDFNMTHRGESVGNDSITSKADQPNGASGDDLVEDDNVQLFRRRLLNLQKTWSNSQAQPSTLLKPKRPSSEDYVQYRLKRNARRRMLEQQTSRLNRDIRRVQAGFAIVICLIGLLFGGLLGFLVGGGFGLLIISLRIRL